MPKGVQNINPEKLVRLKIKLAEDLSISLNANKDYNLLSDVIYERTGALLSNSTLRRVFQYGSDNHPTQSTLDLICKCIGLHSWYEFTEKENLSLQFDLSQLITMFKLQGLQDQVQTRQILEKYSDHPDFFKLLDAIAQIAIANRDIQFLSKLFDIEGVFDKNQNLLPIIYFIHTLVIGLNQSGLMPELAEYYGANPRAQVYMVELYVDEDNLNGYYYTLLQVYHRHKTTAEALLFYNCLMYQQAIENKLSGGPWLEFIRQFSEAKIVHHIPRGRRYAILLLEAGDRVEAKAEILHKTANLYHDLNDVDKITTALYMVKLLFLKREDELIDKVLFLAPDTSGAGKNIDDRTNINQIKIYRAYSLFRKGEKSDAAVKLKEFDTLMVQAFIYKHIMHDYKIIFDLIGNR